MLKMIYSVCILVSVILMLSIAHAGEVRVIELNDGSVLTGEIVSLSSGIYTIRTESLGTLKIEEHRVRSMRMKEAAEKSGSGQGANRVSGEVKSLQDRMMSDTEIMDMIRTLQNDPEFQKILEDPEVMKAVQAGDVTSLMANPKFMKLIENPTVKEIKKKVE